MNFTIRGTRVYTGSGVAERPLSVVNGAIADCIDEKAPVFDFKNCILLPGLVDVHVHFREPGFSYKETIASGSRAAAHGGYTTVCAMPNLNPVPDSAAHLRPELEAIARDAKIRVLPYGALTVGQCGKEIADLEGMAPFVAGFSDDGRGVQDGGRMLEAMLRAKALGKLVAAHCEDERLVRGGVVHDGEYARAHGLPGISSESEWRMIERDLKLAARSGCRYHVCHISTRESVELIRDAKRSGVDVSCETAPHYLLFNDEMLRDEGRFKMNPPLRARRDQEALLAGLIDGTIDIIATDHAPHSAEEKAGGLQNSRMGVVGLETALPALYTLLVIPGIITLETLIDRMHARPCARFGLPAGLGTGAPADFTVFDPLPCRAVDPQRFLSRGRATPFAGRELFGECLLTVCGGEIVYRRAENA